MSSRKTLFAHTPWDFIPTLMGLGHLVFVATLFFGFHAMPWALWIPIALVYSISISWSINSTSHNFIHNAFFTSPLLNRIYSVILSITNGFSQEFYHHVHLRHHVGNMDRIGANGTTIDPISIWRHGKDGKPENPWTYTFCGYFRDDIGEVSKRVKEKFPEKAKWIWREIYIVVGLYLVCLAWDWRAFLALVPFYYFGHSLASLNAYYEHLKGNPDEPIAWGVSTYNKLYNWTWLYNGFHAEHHYRPKTHWTKMVELRDRIKVEQEAAGVHVMSHCHAFGWLDTAPPRYTILRRDPSTSTV